MPVWQLSEVIPSGCQSLVVALGVGRLVPYGGSGWYHLWLVVRGGGTRCCRVWWYEMVLEGDIGCRNVIVLGEDGWSWG